MCQARRQPHRTGRRRSASWDSRLADAPRRLAPLGQEDAENTIARAASDRTRRGAWRPVPAGSVRSSRVRSRGPLWYDPTRGEVAGACSHDQPAPVGAVDLDANGMITAVPRRRYEAEGVAA